MKKLFSVMMALVLALSLSVSAFATGTDGSITINNATSGETYSVYKIFNATYNNTASDITYTITSDNPFFAKMFGTSGDSANDYFTYYKSTGVVTRKEGKTDAELFGYLAGLVEDVAPTQTEAADSTTVEFTDLETGYYVIKRTNGTTNGVTITAAAPHADVYDKNQIPGELDKKIKLKTDADWDTDDMISANVGDIVDFKVEFMATNYNDGTKVQKYTITDTLSPSGWAEIDTNSIVVKVNGTTLANDAWELKNGSVNGFTLEIPWVNNDADKSFKYASPVDVVVTYSATVLESAASADPVNKNNLNTVTSDWDREGDSTTTKLYNLGFTKVDGTNPDKTLSGAKFKLYSDSGCTKLVNVTSNNGVYTVGGTSNEVVTPASGQVVIMGLKAGTYYLKETVAPDGYNLLTDVKSVTVGDGTPVTMKINGTDYIVNNGALTIENNTGVELPSTGGEGTMMLITIGTMVAMAFAVLLITHKKMSIYHD